MNVLYKLKDMDKYTKLAVLTILIGILIRFILVISYSVAGDACWHLSNAKFMANNLDIPLFEPLGREQPFWSPPAFHIISAIFFKLFWLLGSDAADFGIKLVSPLFGSLSLIVSYLILSILFDKKTSFYGILFLTFLPISMDYGIFSYADGMLTFFVVTSIYYALKNKTAISALSLSLAILTKYTGLFVIPVILYITFLKNKKSFWKKFTINFLVVLLVSSPWYIRNWIYLKNPVYPLLNSMFNGIDIGTTYSNLDFSRIISINSLIYPFLEFFGVPDGNLSNIFFFNMPYLSLLLVVWLAAVIAFSFPIFFGLNIKRETRNIVLVLLLTFLIVTVLHILNVGWSTGRRLLPITIILAFFWGNGITQIIKKIRNKNIEKIILIILAIIIIGFVFTSFIRINLAANQWNLFEDDFEWVKQNTDKDAIFIVGGQCIPYHIDRTSLSLSELKTGNYNYIWVNQNFRLDKRSILSKEHLQEIESKNKELVYHNLKTNTKIYKLIQ